MRIVLEGEVRIRLDLTGDGFSVAWEMIEGHPKRVGRIQQTLYWPELPEGRVSTADRVAKLCPIDATLHAGTEVTSRVQRD